ncbi:MAG: hypothetical protein HOW73_14845 [Polyangiaceae bacterium]|nr:hypothetical protein [Polyangiaceae bacterium]
MKRVSLCALVALAAAACVADDDDAGTYVDPPEGTPLEFKETETLELAPREVATVRLRTDANETVALLLLGDALDASLDSTSVRANDSGDASVELTAPTQPTTFVLRAQIDGEASAELHVAVSEQGFTTMKIVPTYQGKRSLDSWSADVLVGGDCESILAGYPADPVGALHVESEQKKDLELESVPVGPQLAVAVRSGSLAAGCVPFAATKPDGKEEVAVTMLDRPMLLTAAELNLRLEFLPDPMSYAVLVQAAGTALADAAFPTETPFASLLLETMSADLPNDAAYSLMSLRETTTLDEQLAVLLGNVDPHAACLAMAESGTAAALADVDSRALKIEGRLLGSGDAPLAPNFQLTSFAGLDASTLGSPMNVAFSWSATADDVLVVSGLLPLSPARLVGAYMNGALSVQLGTETTVTGYIASLVDCPAVAGKIIEQGGVATCDETCLVAACTTAIQNRWEQGLMAGDSLDGSAGSLQIGASAAAVVDNELLPTELDGSWIGTLKSPKHECSVSGDATGEAIPPG